MNESPATDAEESDELDTLARVKAAKKEADKAQGEWRDESRTCYAFVAGDQWEADDRKKLEEMLRAPVVFNRVGPMVDAVAGSEVNNRQSVQYIPRQAGDTGVNEVLTGAADYIRDNCDAEDEESDSFLDATICGVGVTETHLDYVDSQEGNILVERRDPLSMRWDPSAKKRNLSDRKWHQREEWLDKEDIEAKWPDSEIEASSDWGSSDSDEEGMHDQSLAWLYERDATGYDKQSGKYRVIHHQWFELESYHIVLDTDPMTGQPKMIEVSADDMPVLKERAAKVGMPIKSVAKQRKKFMQAFVTGGTVLEESPCPCNRFSYHFITAKRDRNKNTWYGIVRPMLDPQRWANKFFSQLLHIINTNAKGGLVVEEGATDNHSKLKNDWAKADSVVTVNDGAISGGKIMPKPAPNIPPQINDMLTFSISSLRDVTGINLELLGMADRQQAGILEAQRKQAAMTVLATLFDGLRRYRKEQGRTLALYIRDYMSDGRLVRIVGGDGTEKYIPLLRDSLTIDVDVIVDEAPNTVNRKEQTFAVLMQMMPNLERMGVPFMPELLEYTPLPAAMVDKWQQLIEQQKQQPKQPSPQEITANANMIKAQSGAQKSEADAQLAQAEVPIKQQELGVRALEAQVGMLQAQVERMLAIFQMQNIPPAGMPTGSSMPNMLNHVATNYVQQ